MPSARSQHVHHSHLKPISGHHHGHLHRHVCYILCPGPIETSETWTENTTMTIIINTGHLSNHAIAHILPHTFSPSPPSARPPSLSKYHPHPRLEGRLTLRLCMLWSRSWTSHTCRWHRPQRSNGSNLNFCHTIIPRHACQCRPQTVGTGLKMRGTNDGDMQSRLTHVIVMV